MRRISFLIEKEFNQIFRNTILLRIMVAAPVLQLVLLSYAANFEVKNLKLLVLDQDHSAVSGRLVSKFSHIQNLTLQQAAQSYKQAYAQLRGGRADLMMVIPPHDRDLSKTGSANNQLMANAIDGTKAGIASG